MKPEEIQSTLRLRGITPLRLKRSIVLGFKSIWMRKLRSLLTALGIVFGVCSVISMLAIGEGASYEAQQQIKSLGSQNIILQSIKPSDNSGSSEQNRSIVLEYGITYDDVAQIQETVPGVNSIVPNRKVKDFIWFLSNSIDATAVGTVAWFPEMRNRFLKQGRFFTQVENNTRSNVCVLTEKLASKLFPLHSPVGKTVRMRTSYFTVIGIIEDQVTAAKDPSTGDSQPQSDSEDGMEMYVPINVLKEHFGDVLFKYRSGSFEAEKVELHEVTIQVENADLVVSSSKAIKNVLSRNHRQQDYKITIPLELMQQAERTKQIFNIVLGSIAAISLVVGGIGIMNIMLATVTERTREIGIRRALGAKKNDIILQFLIETILLSGIGGLIGVGLGISIPQLISHFAEMKTIIQIWAPTAAFSISVLIGIIFGIYPAMRAAAMRPVEALRHE
jgi:putative ABC transport system permease protein